MIVTGGYSFHVQVDVHDPEVFACVAPETELRKELGRRPLHGAPVDEFVAVLHFDCDVVVGVQVDEGIVVNQRAEDGTEERMGDDGTLGGM